jgi:hypothetical protein
MNNKFFKEIPHAQKPPLQIERSYENGVERIIVEGVVYDADYFRTFSHPDTDVLYAVARDDDGVVRLEVIDGIEKAMRFFEEIADREGVEDAI